MLRKFEQIDKNDQLQKDLGIFASIFKSEAPDRKNNDNNQ